MCLYAISICYLGDKIHPQIANSDYITIILLHFCNIINFLDIIEEERGSESVQNTEFMPV